MKRAILLASIVALGAIGYWIVSGGIGEAIDQNFRQGFDESGEAKVDIAEKFHGSWKFVAKIEPDGTRSSVEDSHILELSADSMVRRKMSESVSSSPPEPIYISDGGELWIVGDPDHEDTHVANLDIGASELHLVAVLDEHHLVYERLETKPAEQGVDDQHAARCE